ncbi:CLUMA_CG017569, isoform A [Clunio marinus]|uniref:CLUMA_CG017569, isoform A n=1 Tax=Clunio marinus TaxID=568069 RepID=A0A1J1IWL1_9DIPT|nr:CLUMA_CG017569, isoform A [Clunio marinus]
MAYLSIRKEKFTYLKLTNAEQRNEGMKTLINAAFYVGILQCTVKKPDKDYNLIFHLRLRLLRNINNQQM